MNPYNKAQLPHNPLLCWDIASQAPFRRRNFHDISQFINAHLHHKWFFEIPKIEDESFEAIVVTDINERILWTSPGFKIMTGYSIREAIGKKPSFLQGPTTEIAPKKSIREAIQQRMKVSATLTNYRKDKSQYACHIEIQPLFSSDGELVNFLALEREVIV